MNKEFARKHVMRLANQLPDDDQGLIRFGDIMAIIADVADDSTGLDEIPHALEEAVMRAREEAGYHDLRIDIDGDDLHVTYQTRPGKAFMYRTFGHGARSVVGPIAGLTEWRHRLTGEGLTFKEI